MTNPPIDANVGLASSLRRYFPNSEVPAAAFLQIESARNERVSFQVVVRTAKEGPVKVSALSPSGVASRVRRVGYVFIKHFNTETPATELEGIGALPGVAPDPLYDESEYHAGPFETNAFWVNLHPDASLEPGTYNIPVSVHVGDLEKNLTVSLNVHNAILEPRSHFPVTHWFYCDALCDYYDLKPFEGRFWEILEKYVVDLVEHGNDTMHTPLFTPPTDGVKRPNQLLKVTRANGRYVFDWSDVQRFLSVARRCGMKFFEWSHFFSQWGCKNAIRIYDGDPGNEVLLWPAETLATSDEYREFLSQFLPVLKNFLEEESVLESSFFHISDEPHGEEALAYYRAAREMMRQLAPWMKFMDALSQIDFANEGLIDVPIPSISTASEFVSAGYPAWCYFCCGPRGEYLNRLIDTPLAKIRMSGWLFYRLRSKGFLHWGYNYWYRSQTRQLIDPFTEQAGGAWPGWAYGDPFVVYPGVDGPIDSIRWEVFAESLQDYALLCQTGISPEGGDLAEIEDYNQFPKDETWLTDSHRKLLVRLD